MKWMCGIFECMTGWHLDWRTYTQNSVDITFSKLFFAHSHKHTHAHIERLKLGNTNIYSNILRRRGNFVCTKCLVGLQYNGKCVLSHAAIRTVNGTSWLLECYLTHKDDCHEQCVVFKNFSQLYCSLAQAIFHTVLSTFPLCLFVFTHFTTYIPPTYSWGMVFWRCGKWH